MLAPFRGIRYARDRVSGIANVTSPPYDVINDGILDHLRAADPHNVVRLILPGEDADASQAAAGLLREWLSAGVLIRDRMPALYLYEQSGDGLVVAAARHHRPGPAGLAGVGGHPAARGRHAGPGGRPAGADGGHPGQPGADLPHLRRRARPATATAETATEVIDRVAAERAPLVTITTEDGVTHRLWRLGDPGEQAAIAADLAGRRALIADGHHRYAAYLDMQAEMRAAGLGAGPWDYGLAFLVDSAAYPPRLGAIHRVLPGLPPERAAELAKAAFTVQDLPAGISLDDAQRRLAAAGQEGTAFLLAGGSACADYWLLSHPDPVQVAASMPAGASASWRRLDASVLQQLLIGRLWGITDSERDVLIDHDAADAVRRLRDRHRGDRGDLEPGLLRGRHRDRGAGRAGAAQIHVVRP